MGLTGGGGTLAWAERRVESWEKTNGNSPTRFPRFPSARDGSFLNLDRRDFTSPSSISSNTGAKEWHQSSESSTAKGEENSSDSPELRSLCCAIRLFCLDIAPSNKPASDITHTY